MDLALIVNLTLLVIALVLSGFFSSSETAFMGLDRLRLRHLQRTGASGIKRVQRLADERDRTLVTILIGNNLVNTAAAALGTVLAANVIGAGAAVPVATLGVTILLLVFGEITPKTVAVVHGERLVFLYALPLDALSKVAAPLTAVLARLGRAVAAWVGGQRTKSGLSQEEIRTVLLMGEESGVLQRNETAILHNVLGLQNTLAREVMVPRTEMVAVPARAGPPEALTIAAEARTTRLPVYEGNLDQIVGLVHVVDLIAASQSSHPPMLREVMQPTLVVPETIRASDLLNRMSSARTGIAILLDEYGGTAGLVTTHDLLERMVGPLLEVKEVATDAVERLPDGDAMIGGLALIRDVNEQFGLQLGGSDFTTIGGFILAQLGHIPAHGEEVRVDEYVFRVESLDGNRVERLRLTKSSGEPNATSDANTSPPGGQR